jgi:hypothetical protein
LSNIQTGLVYRVMGSIRGGSGADRKALLSTEFSDRSHPGTVIACANKHEVRRRLRELCAAMGAHERARLWRPTHVVDGWCHLFGVKPLMQAIAA